jgi:Domain of unknown function DUF11
MKNIHTQEQINEMRRRLYDRGTEVEKIVKHTLSDEPVNVTRDWAGVANSSPITNTNDVRSSLPAGIESNVTSDRVTTEEVKPKRHYRRFVLLGSLLIFIFGTGIASLYLYFGGNQISGDNIIVAINGPAAIGGGEVLPLQITVTNQNSVAVQAATLILKYPSGTRSVGENPRNLYEERILVESLDPGEVQSIPVRIAIFGEENAEKNISATVEYRIDGSNGTFYKDAEPLAFRISSSPLVLRIEHIEKVASGQVVDVTMTAVSNASSPLEDILITAAYPNGFAFESSDPEPYYGQNVWKIDEILPEQTVTIKLKGIVSGLTEETFRINFAAGPQNPSNQNDISAALTESTADFVIERPFIDIAISINGEKDRNVIIPESKSTAVILDIKNTLDETVYDMVVEVVPSGNALIPSSIKSRSGFYNSNSSTVRWEVSNNEDFDRILPGEVRTLEFEIEQGPEKTTSAFDLTVNVYARRVAESSAVETLIGTVDAQAKYSSMVYVSSQVGKNTADYIDIGPVPPEVGVENTYTITLVGEAGANDMSNAIVETSLPLYVDWLDIYDAEGAVTYNSVSKRIQWAIGDISSGQRKEMTFQISTRPSISQLNSTPVLVNKQQVRANDRFTGELLQNESPAVTTELSTELGYEKDNGIVKQ